MGIEGTEVVRAEVVSEAEPGTRGALGPARSDEGGGDGDVGRATEEGDRGE